MFSCFLEISPANAFTSKIQKYCCCFSVRRNRAIYLSRRRCFTRICTRVALVSCITCSAVASCYTSTAQYYYLAITVFSAISGSYCITQQPPRSAVLPWFYFPLCFQLQASVLQFYSIIFFVFLEFISYRLLSRSYLTICYKRIFLPTVPFMKDSMIDSTCFASPFLNLEIIFPSIRWILSLHSATQQKSSLTNNVCLEFSYGLNE